MMSWGSIVLCVGVVLAVWFAWSTYRERQARTPPTPTSGSVRPTPDLQVCCGTQMEAEALRAARAARQRWAVPPQDLTLAQARSAHPPRRPTVLTPSCVRSYASTTDLTAARPYLCR